MKWAKTIIYSGTIEVDGVLFTIKLEEESTDNYALFIAGEYTCDVDSMPTEEWLEDKIREVVILNEESLTRYPNGGIS